MRSTASFLRVIAFAVLGYFFLELVASSDGESVFREQPWLWAFFGAILLF